VVITSKKNACIRYVLQKMSLTGLPYCDSMFQTYALTINWIHTTTRRMHVCCQKVFLCTWFTCGYDSSMVCSLDALGHLSVTSISKTENPDVLLTSRKWGTAPLILSLGVRWRSVVNFKPRALYPRGKGFKYALYRKYRHENL